jgi:hypothetical protein
MSSKIKELLWCSMPFIIAGVAFNVLTLFNLNSILLSFYDAVFVIPSICIIVSLTIIFGFIIYLARVVALRFRNTACNYIYLIYNTLLVTLLSIILHFHDKLSVDGGWAIYPPLSASPQKIEAHNFIAEPIYLMITQFIVVVLLTYTAIKIGKNTNKPI